MEYLESFHIWPQQFSYELVLPAERRDALPDSVLSVSSAHTLLSNAKDPLRLKVHFRPNKPMHVAVELLLRSSLGAAWSCELDLQARSVAIQWPTLTALLLAFCCRATVGWVRPGSLGEASSGQIISG